MLFTHVPVSFVCRGFGYILHHPARGVACNPLDLGVVSVENFPSDYASLFPLHPLEFSSGKYK